MHRALAAIVDPARASVAFLQGHRRARKAIEIKQIGQSLRQSGVKIRSGQQYRRSGLAVWGNYWEAKDWELTEGFVWKFGHLLNDCEDLIASSNTWRAHRGEPPLPTHRRVSGSHTKPLGQLQAGGVHRPVELLQA